MEGIFIEDTYFHFNECRKENWNRKSLEAGTLPNDDDHIESSFWQSHPVA
jgi:hypothetical protein